MPIAGALVAVAAGLAGFVVTWLVRRYAGRLGLVARPDPRSSHEYPTPTGGGAGIVAGSTLAGLSLSWAEPWPMLAVIALGLVVAAIGFADDRRPIPARARLIAQFVLVLTLIIALPLEALAAAIGLHWPPLLFGAALILPVVYWINVFNFMDGIDGLAASQAIFMLAAAALLATAASDQPYYWWMVAIATATVGFLALNWPPAKVFMGDAGSTYLGFAIAAVALSSIAAGWLSLWQWLILGALFATDATITLIRRALRGEQILVAHRLHAYQHLARRWGSHRPVTLSAIVINVVVLLPLAWSAGALPGFGPLAVLLAYMPLVLLLLWAGAGAREQTR